MVEKRDGETGESFNGREETTRCRVCDAPRFSARVESGSGAYETAWLRCEACGSWSIARVPEPEKLERFYVEYAVHHRAAAVNPGANDGRRYTSAFEGTRRAEYRFGLTDVRLTFRRGDVVVDYGAQDGVFLDEVRSLEPGVTSTVAVDYVAPEGAELASRGHRFESIASWSAEDSPVDVLTLWDVYEHLSDPNAFFALAARRLRSGGRLLVQTPNASIHADILGARWHHFLPVQHLQLPSRLGLVAHAQRFGFNLLHACSFGANAPPEVVPQPYKRLFDTLAKQADLGSTQIVLFERP